LAVVGLYLSNWLDVASGATIVLMETALFVAVLALGPRTGVLSRLGRRSELVEATQ
jgi:ABC-type Mn2+/Zn2+ transport system permease subunit